MSRERIIKQQARESLRGNITALIAGFLALAVMGVIIFDVPVFAAYLLNLVDAESGEVTGDSFLWYLLLEFGALVLAAVFSPLINGFFRLAADTAVKGGCEINSFFYFFSSPRRYFRTLAVNMGLCALYSLLTAPLAIAGRLLGGRRSACTCDHRGACDMADLRIYLLYPLSARGVRHKRQPSGVLLCIRFYRIFIPLQRSADKADFQHARLDRALLLHHTYFVCGSVSRRDADEFGALALCDE